MIEVPQSVMAYFTQPAVATAVDLLLSGKKPKVPENLRWDELAAFYRACLAAQQVQAEYAILMEKFWRAIWQVPPSFTPTTPHDPGRRDMSVAISTIWDQGYFSRGFKKSDWWLDLTVYLEDSTGFQVGVGLWRGSEFMLDKGALPNWASEDSETLWTSPGLVPLVEVVDPSPFRELADDAMELVSTLTRSK